MQPFKAGIGLLASELNIPIVPIKLDGLFELKKRKQYFVRPGTVSVTFGVPIEFTRAHSPTEITSELEQAIHRLHR